MGTFSTNVIFDEMSRWQNLYAFVVDVDSNKLINISYFQTLFELHGDSLIVHVL